MRHDDVQITSGMALRRALKAAEQLGCSQRQVNRRGELLVWHPVHHPLYVRINQRRQDAPRSLTTMLQQVHRKSATLQAV